MNKVVGTLKEAISLSGLRDGMCVCFHHHLRNGDYVFDMAMTAIRELGIKDLTLLCSSVMDCDTQLPGCVEDGTVTALETDYMSKAVGAKLNGLKLSRPIDFHTHGHFDAVIASGQRRPDLFILAAPTCDEMGNLTGKTGPSACGSLGYAFTPARASGKVIAVTDNLVPYPLSGFSIPEIYVDYVVRVEKIGDRAGIVSGTTVITRDPVKLRIAKTACDVICASGLLKDGFSFQTGAGGISLAAARFLKERMLAGQIRGSFIMGGTTRLSVDLLESGCFETLYDVQCMDLTAVDSLNRNPGHVEVSNAHYASPLSKSCIVESLDAAVLGATEIDVDFNVNVHTDSNGSIMGGSGGHSDIAACNKLAIVVAPLWRNRLPVVRDHVGCISTPGSTVDVFVSQMGIAVNPARPGLRERLAAAGMELREMEELKALAESYTGTPNQIRRSDKILARVLYRDGTVLDTIRAVE